MFQNLCCSTQEFGFGRLWGYGGYGGLCPHPLRDAVPENPAKGDDPLWKPLLLPRF